MILFVCSIATAIELNAQRLTRFQCFFWSWALKSLSWHDSQLLFFHNSILRGDNRISFSSSL